MERPLKFFSLLSLEEMALRKSTAILWNCSDILASVMKLQHQENILEKWRTIVDKVKNKLINLHLPESLTEQMVDLVTPIGLEIRNWEEFHRKTFNFSCIEIFEQDSAKLCFTTAGTVDDRRTAQEIVRCHKIDVVQRYVIACSYWLEDCIPILWRELTQENKDYFYKKNPALEGLECSWPRVFKDGESILDCYLRKLDINLTSFNQKGFEHSAKEGYKATAEHFFRKLLPGERGTSLMRSAHTTISEIHTAPDHVQGRLRNVLHYLLLSMTPEQQIEIVKAYPVQVMSCFLDWPRRELFSGNAALIWPFLPPHHYEDLLMELLSYDVSHFPEFFKESPLCFKKYLCSGPSCFAFSFHFLVAFFDSKDSESIELMFRSADLVPRTKFLFQGDVLQLFHDSISRGDWRLVEVCLREAALSRIDRKRLKERFLHLLHKGVFSNKYIAPYGTKSYVSRMKDIYPKLKSFFDFLDGTDASSEKEWKGHKRKLENCSSE